jgi:hypothetical protein
LPEGLTIFARYVKMVLVTPPRFRV